jgi:uncharacterized phage infection (PIP) family protein YhgE
VKITPIWEKTALDGILKTELTEIVAEEVSQDAREKKEKIRQLEDAILKQRNGLLKLKKRREELKNMLEVAEERQKELRNLSEDVLSHKVNSSDIKMKLKAIFT